MKARINATVALLGVAAATSIGGAQTLDRSKVPALGPPPKVSLPPIVTRQLPNGLKLMVVEQHELPLADFVLVVGSGGTMDPATKGGVANLTSGMLTEGTTSRSALEIADQVAFLGIGLNAGSSSLPYPWQEHIICGSWNSHGASPRRVYCSNGSNRSNR